MDPNRKVGVYCVTVKILTKNNPLKSFYLEQKMYICSTLNKRIMTQLFTSPGKSYWNSNGIYQEQYDSLYKKLVPQSGTAETLHGELIRSISRLFYDFCNNGNCNACEAKYGEDTWACHGCGGTGQVEDGEDEDGNLEMSDCYDCNGSGEMSEETIEEVFVTPFYRNFLDLIEKSVPNIHVEIDHVVKVIKQSIDHGSDYFNDTNMGHYNKLSDRVIFHVLTTEDSKIPEWYGKED